MDNSLKLYAELSSSDSKFRRTIIIIKKRVIDLEVFLSQRDARIFELEERIRERKFRVSITYEVFTRPEPEQPEREKKAGVGNQPLGEGG
jgi:hypothetical protein